MNGVKSEKQCQRLHLPKRLAGHSYELRKASKTRGIVSGSQRTCGVPLNKSAICGVWDVGATTLVSSDFQPDQERVVDAQKILVGLRQLCTAMVLETTQGVGSGSPTIDMKQASGTLQIHISMVQVRSLIALPEGQRTNYPPAQ